MGKSKVAATVEKIVTPLVMEEDYDLVDIEYVKEGGLWYLRIFIDKPGGVNLDDCQRISEKISPLLDAEDPIPQAYILEVSSPGVERPLKNIKDFQRFRGHQVKIKTFTPIASCKNFMGRLLDVDDEGIVIEINEGKFVIPLGQIASARLVFKF